MPEFHNRYFVPVFVVAVILANYTCTSTVSLVERKANHATYLCESDDGTLRSNSIQWFFNDCINHCCLSAAEKNGAYLKIKLTPVCEGFIRCGTFENIEFRLSTTKLPMYAYPELLELPYNSTVHAITGSNVTIECDIVPSVFSNFDIQWHYNLGPDGNATTLSNENGYELQLINVNPSNNGEYYCSATAKPNRYLAFMFEYSIVDGRIIRLVVEPQPAVSIHFQQPLIPVRPTCVAMIPVQQSSSQTMPQQSSLQTMPQQSSLQTMLVMNSSIAPSFSVTSVVQQTVLVLQSTVLTSSNTIIGIAAGTSTGVVFFLGICILIFIVLPAVVYWKHYKKSVTQQDHIYDYVEPSSPPQLPPPRLTTHDNPAYEKVEMNDCVAYSSNLSQEVEN